MSTQPFSPQGNTVAISANTALAITAQVASTTLGGSNYLVTNPGNVTVFLGVGATSAAANAGAVVITAGGNAPTIPLLAASSHTYSFAPNAWFAAINGGVASNTTIYITPGDGVI